MKRIKKPNNLDEAKKLLHECIEQIKIIKKKYGISKRAYDSTILKKIINSGDGKFHNKNIYVGHTHTKFGFYKRPVEMDVLYLINTKSYLFGYIKSWMDYEKLNKKH